MTYVLLIKQFHCFFFLSIFENFLVILFQTENTRLIFVLVILTDAPITVANETRATPPLVAIKQAKFCQPNQKFQYAYWVFYTLLLFYEFKQYNSLFIKSKLHSIVLLWIHIYSCMIRCFNYSDIDLSLKNSLRLVYLYL